MAKLNIIDSYPKAFVVLFVFYLAVFVLGLDNKVAGFFLIAIAVYTFFAKIYDDKRLQV